MTTKAKKKTPKFSKAYKDAFFGTERAKPVQKQEVKPQPEKPQHKPKNKPKQRPSTPPRQPVSLILNFDQ